eukprot:GHVU01148087.1.p1 GENE.GHVU01148087.1~~GHVU01148087.1.p1  ORF type:complete len:198 (-),score=27.91 GHVU01148087.1:137-730(-)
MSAGFDGPHRRTRISPTVSVSLPLLLICFVLYSLAVAAPCSATAQRSRFLRLDMVSAKEPKEDPSLVDIDECTMMHVSQGIDRDNCDCPPGYVLCSYRELSNRIGTKLMWPQVSKLCSIGKYKPGTLLYTDAGTFVTCDPDDPEKKFFKKTEAMASGVPPKHRICALAHYFLCKRVGGSDKRDCKMDNWSEWSHCAK